MFLGESRAFLALFPVEIDRNNVALPLEVTG